MVTRTYKVRTHGCQMNVHDSERIAGLLDEAGYAPVADGAQPDVVVFSTCAVRENADNKLDGNLGHLKPVKHRTPGMQIAVGLRRMFSSLAGMPLSEYVRRRRMTVAAAEVVTADRGPALLRGHQRRRNRIGHHHRIFNIDIARRHSNFSRSRAGSLQTWKTGSAASRGLMR
jgi:hypothetical protein